ncbi:acyl-CoA synthetases/AMP-acid ligases II [Rhizodiscina lignyota]|uniref:Acyl-CoA synthetases/AMP-acid ligases II n=1 Tax=Rhizodiscina lignyota TaxID=1504668 RepID=A0A9P4IUA2_9PEZI|nr:acyl-CoA synthetases/AMP-acid ligases II [Rhizodiscina lignyota]
MPQWIYRSKYPEPNAATNQSVSQFLLKSNPDDVTADTTIWSDFDEPDHKMTFGGIREQAALGAAGLREVLGVKEGDFVYIYASNSVNWAYLSHSVMWAGAVFSAINPLASAHELIHYFSLSEPVVVATDAALLPKVESALSISPELKVKPKVILFGHGKRPNSKGYQLFPQDIVSTQRPALSPFDLSSRDNREVPAGMCFSSGTSGRPKGVLLSHYSLIAYNLTGRATDPFLYNGFMREVFFPSFAHIYGLVIGMLMPAFFGSHVVAMPQFDFVQYFQRCAEIRATCIRLVPSTAIRLAKDAKVSKLDLTSVQTMYCSGASLPIEVAEKLQVRLKGCSILNGYGMSEGTITMLRSHHSTRKTGSVGKPAAGVEMRVVDDNYNDVEPGQRGEVLVKGPTMFMRYKNNPTETATSFKDGWLCTGDVAIVDEEGFFWLTGRKKELIKYKGYQVPPAELEEVLLSHPLVTDAGVCGVYNEEQATEIPVGYVTFRSAVTRMSREGILEEVRDYVDSRVAPYKKLRGGLFYLDEIPKGPTGKLLRLQLPAKVEERRKSKV